jgi:flagellar biosynthesis/type III secretory pathway protein FliH
MKKEEEIDNKIKTEIRNGDTENLEEMAQRIKDEDIEPPKIENLGDRTKSWYCSYDNCPPWSSFLGFMVREIAQEKQKYRQEILGRLPKEREEVNELNPKDYESILEYARTKGYNQTLQKIKELIRKI